MNVLDDWLARCAAELGVPWQPADRDALLDLTRDVAHGVARPAAPLTSYLVGIAVGQGRSLAEATEQVTALLPAEDDAGPQRRAQPDTAS